MTGIFIQLSIRQFHECKRVYYYKVSPEHEGPEKRYKYFWASYMDELSVSVVATVDPEDITRSEVEPYACDNLGSCRRNICSTAQPMLMKSGVHIYLPDDTPGKHLF